MGQLLKVKFALGTLAMRMRNLASTSVPFRPTAIQMPNFVLIETKNYSVLPGIGLASRPFPHEAPEVFL
jgi:hypothetical protein